MTVKHGKKSFYSKCVNGKTLTYKSPPPYSYSSAHPNTAQLVPSFQDDSVAWPSIRYINASLGSRLSKPAASTLSTSLNLVFKNNAYRYSTPCQTLQKDEEELFISAIH